MLNKNIIENNITEIIDGYFANPNFVEEHYKNEIANQAEYRGREILELLQNAIDELSEEKRNVKIEFNSQTRILKVCNNGNVFTEKGLKSIMYSQLSPKYENSQYIGNKGTGFKSALNWADDIKIYSGELAIHFSKLTAVNKFKSLLEDKYKDKNKKLKSFCKSYNLENIAILRFPEIIDKIDTKFDTTIELQIKKKFLEDVKRQINLIDDKTILFLDKLQKLEINIDSKKTIFTRKEQILDKNNFINNVIISCNDKNTEWTILKETNTLKIENNYKRYIINIAYNEEDSKNTNNLYCFFKTSIKFPIGFLVNATIDLDGGREHLLNKEYNTKVLKEIFSLCIKLSQYIAKDKKADYTMLNLLAPKSDFDVFIIENGLEQFYYTLLKKAEIFPNVNNEYIKLNENIKYYKISRTSKWAEVLFGDGFDNLLKTCPNENCENLLFKLFSSPYNKDYQYSELCFKIGNNINNYKKDKNILAKFCKYFITDFEYHLKNDVTKPNIILDSNNDLVNTSKNIIFISPSNNDILDLPSFSSIKFISTKLLDSLKQEFGINDVSKLVQELYPLNIKRYDGIEVIRQVFTELSNENSIDEHIEGIIWLYKIYKTKDIDLLNPNITSLSFKLPNKNNEIVDVKKLYFAKSYDEPMMENLLNKADVFICDYDKFKLLPEEKQTFKHFLKILGVKNKPRLIKQEIYKSYFPEKYTALLNRSDNSEISTILVETYEYLDEILNHAKTIDLLDWIMSDSSVKAKIMMKESDNIGYKQSYYKSFSYGKKIPSWLNFKLSNTKWIDNEDKRLSPNQCTIKNVGNILEPYLYEINIEKLIKNRNLENQEDDLLYLFRSLGLVDDYWKLDSERIYQILIYLYQGQKDLNGKYTKSIYNSMLQAEIYHESIISSLDKNGTNRQKFFSNGKVFCKDGTFHSIKNVKYLSQVNVSKNINNENLIDISPRKNSEFIEKFLGVSPLKLNYEIISKEISNINDEFQKDFGNFKQLAQLYRKDKSSIAEKNKINAINIFLCNNVLINMNDQISILDKYLYVSDKDDSNIIYLNIKNHDSLINLKNNISFAEAISNIMLDIMKISSTNSILASSLRNLYQKDIPDRIQNIKIDFPDYDFEEERNEINNKKILLTNLIGNNSNIKSKIDDINFLNLNSFSNLSIFKDILASLNMSLEDFNEKTNFNLDFTNYNNYNLKEFKFNNQIKYKNNLFTYYKYLSSNNDKKNFLKFYDEFINYTTDKKEPIYDIEKFMSNKFKQLNTKYTNLLNANETYKINKEEFAINKDDDLVIDFLNNKENDSLIYFGDYQELNKLYEVFIEEIREKKNQETECLAKNSSRNYSIKEIETISQTSVNQQQIEQKYLHTKSIRNYRQYDKDNSIWGAKAEEMVVSSLLDSKKYKAVNWVSENARKVKGAMNNPDGKDGLGYDIECIDNNNNRIFVEVKSTRSSNIEFIVTQHEIEIAEQNKKNYKVIIVVNMSDDPQIYDLGFLFDYNENETIFNNHKFSLAVDKYIIKCDKKENN